MERFFAGFDLFEPGILVLPEWRPDAPGVAPPDAGGSLALAGVGRKP